MLETICQPNLAGRLDMSSAYDTLVEEIAAVKEEDYINPLEEMEESESGSVVGEMTPRMLQLFTVWRRAEEKAERLAIDAKYARNKEQQDAMIPSVELARRKAEIVRDLFWLEVHLGFPVPVDGSVAVCTGRKVVHRKSRGGLRETLFGALGHLDH